MFKKVKNDEQIQIVVNLANAIWPVAYQNILSIEQISFMLKKYLSYAAIYEQIMANEYNYFLIYEEKKVIGFFSISEKEEEVFLSKVYLLSEYRKKGYLTKVIKFLNNKKKTITLRVNKENLTALKAYLNLGFIKTEKVKSQIGGGFFMDDYIMKKEFSFKDLLLIEQEKPYFKKLLKNIEEEAKTNKIFPKKENWFKAIELTDFSNVNVVIIGQDPYYNENQAMGLSFSVNTKVKMPPSLVNIYKEIENTYNVKMPSHGNLTGWATQGVLLLNTILTVSEGKPMSHQGFGWEIFTDEIIKLLQKKDFVVYLLLGNHAQKYAKKITNKKHAILMTSHPSPLSSYRGFLGSNIFKKTNELLKENNKEEINWYLL